MKKYRIFVDGSSGTTGLRIADRLAARPEFELLTIAEADRKDPNARAAVINRSDLTFLCLPDAAAKEIIPLVKEDVRILDTSTAHRTASGWLYGMPELDNTRTALKTATRGRGPAAMLPASSPRWRLWCAAACWLRKPPCAASASPGTPAAASP